MNRRAFLFSIVAFVVLVVVASSVLYQQSRDAQSSDAAKNHVRAADAFLGQLEKDLPRTMRITGYRGLLGLEDHVSATGEYLNDTAAAFTSMVTNGTVNGSYYEVMDDATLDVFQQRMEQIAGDLGLTLELAVTDVTLEHESPFVIRVNTTVQVNATTLDEQTRWQYNTTTSSAFRIDDLRDPLWTVGTLGRVPIAIQESNVSHPYITADNDTSRLKRIYNETLYVPDDDAPSLLMRFSGNLSNSTHGIASLVDTKVLDSQDLPVHTDRSVVDHLYFGNSSTTTNEIVNMTDEFLLDDDHLELYDAEDKVVS